MPKLPRGSPQLDGRQPLATAAYLGASHCSLSQIAIPAAICGCRSGDEWQAVTRLHIQAAPPSSGQWSSVLDPYPGYRALRDRGRSAILERMVDNRPQADRILGARLMGSAKRLGRRELPDDEYAAAVAELREQAAGRADLLAETAGLLEGFGEGNPPGR
jgi:hypothetical protein